MKSIDDFAWQHGSKDFAVISTGSIYPDFASLMHARGVSPYWIFICYRDFATDLPVSGWLDGNKRIRLIDQCVDWVESQKKEA